MPQTSNLKKATYLRHCIKHNNTKKVRPYRTPQTAVFKKGC